MRNAEEDGPSCWGDQGRLHVDPNCNLANTLFNTVGGLIAIHQYTFFGHNCMVLTGSHDRYKRNLQRQEFAGQGGDIWIGQGVWIGSGAIILGPCMIGAGAVIAAGSVVLPGSYKAGMLYAGTPAKLKGET